MMLSPIFAAPEWLISAHCAQMVPVNHAKQHWLSQYHLHRIAVPPKYLATYLVAIGAYEFEDQYSETPTAYRPIAAHF